MSGSRGSWHLMLQMAAGTSLLFPLICVAAQVAERAPTPSATVTQDSQIGKPAAPAPQEAPASPTDATIAQAMIPEEEPPKVPNYAVAAAVADGVSTRLVLSAGAIEANPVAASIPLLGLTAAKVALAMYAENLPEKEKRLVLKSSSSIWGGAAVNNLLLLAAATPPVAIVGGILTGIFVWHRTGRKYEERDAQVAALQAAKFAAAAAPAVPELVPAEAP